MPTAIIQALRNPTFNDETGGWTYTGRGKRVLSSLPTYSLWCGQLTTAFGFDPHSSRIVQAVALPAPADGTFSFYYRNVNGGPHPLNFYVTPGFIVLPTLYAISAPGDTAWHQFTGTMPMGTDANVQLDWIAAATSTLGSTTWHIDECRLTYPIQTAYDLPLAPNGPGPMEFRRSLVDPVTRRIVKEGRGQIVVDYDKPERGLRARADTDLPGRDHALRNWHPRDETDPPDP